VGPFAGSGILLFLPVYIWQMKKLVLLYGTISAATIIFLRLIEYRFLILDHSTEIYSGLIAITFSVIGIWLGLKLTRKKEVVIVKEVAPDKTTLFVLNKEKLAELSITQREQEILELIADGLSNQEIAGKLFLSLNTIKTHVSRIFEKLDVKRRTQAVQKAKELRLIP
jgi:NarL family two-component system response regulator LiaR